MPWLLAIVGIAAAEPGVCPAGTAPRSTGVLGRTEVERFCARPDGRWEGPYARIGPSGVLLESGTYVDGLAHGPWSSFHATGTPAETGEMVEGRRLGRWAMGDAGGRRLGTITYADVLPGSPAAGAAEHPAVRWTRPLQGVQGMRALGDTLQLATPTQLLGIDLSTGGTRWGARVAAPVQPDWRMGETGPVAAVPGQGLLSIDIRQGEVRLLNPGRDPAALAAVGEGIATMVEENGRLSGVLLENGRVLWKSSEFVGPAPAAQLGGNAVVARNRDVRVVDRGTGKPLFSTRVSKRVVAVGVAADGAQVFSLDHGGELVGLDVAAGGRPMWDLRLGGMDQIEVGQVRIEHQPEGLVLVGPDRVWVVDPSTGVLQDHRPVPESARTRPDHFAGRTCWGEGEAGLACSDVGPDAGRAWSLEPAWVAEVGTLSGAPAVLDDGVAVHTSRALLVVDTGVMDAGTLVQGGQAQRTGEWVEVILGGGQGLEQGRTASVRAPLVEVRSDPGAGDCPQRATFVDLSHVGPETWAGLGPADAAASQESMAPPTVAIELPSVGRQWASWDDDWDFAEVWDRELLRSHYEVAYWFAQPAQVLAVESADSPETLAWAERAADCLADGGQFRGTVLLDQGQEDTLGRPIQRRIAGRISLESFAHEMAGERACLVELGLGGEALGHYSGTGRDGWVDLYVAVHGTDLDPDLPPAPGVGLPQGPFSGAVELETLGLQSAQRHTWVLEQGAHMRLDTEAPEGLALWAGHGGPEARRLAVPGLRYQTVDDEGHAAFTWRQDWALWGARIDPERDRYLPLWRGQTCADDAEDTAEPELEPTD